MPDVTVWAAALSLSVHVTVLPTLMVKGFGENALSAKVAAPGSIETFLTTFELAAADVAVVVLAATLFLILLREGGVCSILGLVIIGWYDNPYWRLSLACC